MRPNLVISPEELGRDDIEPGVPPAEVRRWEYPPSEIEVVLVRGPKASYPDGVVAFWKAAQACAKIAYSERCVELSEDAAIKRVRSFLDGAHAVHDFELRSAFVAAQEMDVESPLYTTVLIETRHEYIVAKFYSSA